jgi:hypothetical protein
MRAVRRAEGRVTVVERDKYPPALNQKVRDAVGLCHEHAISIEEDE